MRWTKDRRHVAWARFPDNRKPVYERVVTRFLWFPLELRNEVRWLERASIVQRAEPVCYPEPRWPNVDECVWIDEQFAVSRCWHGKMIPTKGLEPEWSI